MVDDGGWYANSSNEEFYSAGCDRPKDYVITNSGPLVTYRSDNMDWDFADLVYQRSNLLGRIKGR